MDVSVNGAASDLTISHGASSVANETIFRVRSDKLISHVPADIVQVISPSDERIKREIESVDEDSLLQRLLKVEVKRYKYTDEWRRVRGLDSV